MSDPLHILFVQHAGSPGGSVVSLRYLVEGLITQGLRVSVAMVEPNADVRRLYERCGADVYDTPEIPLFRHTTAGWAHIGDPRACMYQAQALFKQRSGSSRLLNLIDAIQPDVVHLNSVTLVLAAHALTRAGVRFVWHVRESPASGYFGRRLAFLRESLLQLGDEVVFLSASDQAAWVGKQRGQIIHNVVPIRQAPSPEAIERERRRFGIETGDRAVAYVGGLAEIKGIFPLFDAVSRLLPKFPRLRILAPGMTIPPATTLKAKFGRVVFPALGLERDFERANRLVASASLSPVFRRATFLHDILPVIAACEFLVFPSTRPHFARPIVEAASLAKPSIGSDLGGVSDLIEDGISGLLVPAGDPRSLAAAIEQMLANTESTMQMGLAAFATAQTRFDAASQVERIMQLYTTIIERPALKSLPKTNAHSESYGR